MEGNTDNGKGNNTENKELFDLIRFPRKPEMIECFIYIYICICIDNKLLSLYALRLEFPFIKKF